MGSGGGLDGFARHDRVKSLHAVTTLSSTSAQSPPVLALQLLLGVAGEVCFENKNGLFVIISKTGNSDDGHHVSRTQPLPPSYSCVS